VRALGNSLGRRRERCSGAWRVLQFDLAIFQGRWRRVFAANEVLQGVSTENHVLTDLVEIVEMLNLSEW